MKTPRPHGEGQKKTPRIPRRYRLGPRSFNFKFVGKQLTEMVTGMPSYCTANSTVVGVDSVPKDAKFHPRKIYLRTDGAPVGSYSRFLLRRDMTDFLCVWFCRLAPEPRQDDPDPDDLSGWEELLREEGFPAELPNLSSSGFTSVDLEKLRSHDVVFARSPRQRRQFSTLPSLGVEEGSRYAPIPVPRSAPERSADCPTCRIFLPYARLG